MNQVTSDTINRNSLNTTIQIRLLTRTGYFVIIPVKKKKKKKSSKYTSGPRSYFSISPKVNINKQKCKGMFRSNVVLPLKFLIV